MTVMLITLIVVSNWPDIAYLNTKLDPLRNPSGRKKCTNIGSLAWLRWTTLKDELKIRPVTVSIENR